MQRRVFLIVILLIALGAINPSHLLAVPIDFSTFDEQDLTVTVLGPGAVSITEDYSTAPVRLRDFDIPIPDGSLSLSFDFQLNVPVGNEDYFDFYFNNPGVPSDSFGGTEGFYSGTITKDLNGFGGSTLELIFSLNWGWDDFGYDSVLTISNAAVNPVPEPASMVVMVFGILWLAALRRR